LLFLSRVDWCVVNADISGVPGTGSTATLHAVARQLKRMAEFGVSRDSSTSSCLTLTYVFRKKIHSGKVSPGTTFRHWSAGKLEGFGAVPQRWRESWRAFVVRHSSLFSVLEI